MSHCAMRDYMEKQKGVAIDTKQAKENLRGKLDCPVLSIDEAVKSI